MATSTITKKALADSLIKLMEEKPYDKIKISDICDGCDMNRKSFYYHFKEKSELVKWIFQCDVNEVITQKYYDNTWKVIEKIAEVFDRKRVFYKDVISTKDANVFRKNFEEFFKEISLDNFRGSLDKTILQKFQLEFLAIAFRGAFENWIMQYDDMSIKEFIKELDVCMKYLADIYEEA